MRIEKMRSNTVMAVVPDSNRIPFASTQLTTFQTVFSSSATIISQIHVCVKQNRSLLFAFLLNYKFAFYT